VRHQLDHYAAAGRARTLARTVDRAPTALHDRRELARSIRCSGISRQTLRIARARVGNIPFELALEIDPSDSADISQLEKNGWSVVPPVEVAASPWSYQKYIQNSWAEFGVAKGMYVQSRSGWISDRSICYLASGRPVLIQDTSLGNVFPVSSGMLLFSTQEEAAAGAQRLSNDYRAHARAARDVACEFFDSDKVLRKLLDRVGVSVP
jgi:hypothetical protein